MKKAGLIFFLFISSASIARQFPCKRDIRPARVKDPLDNFQATSSDHLSVLKALEVAGIRTFNFAISPTFTEEHKVAVMLNEYDQGKLVMC